VLHHRVNTYPINHPPPASRPPASLSLAAVPCASGVASLPLVALFVRFTTLRAPLGRAAAPSPSGWRGFAHQSLWFLGVPRASRFVALPGWLWCGLRFGGLRSLPPRWVLPLGAPASRVAPSARAALLGLCCLRPRCLAAPLLRRLSLVPFARPARCWLGPCLRPARAQLTLLPRYTLGRDLASPRSSRESSALFRCRAGHILNSHPTISRRFTGSPLPPRAPAVASPTPAPARSTTGKPRPSLAAWPPLTLDLAGAATARERPPASPPLLAYIKRPRRSPVRRPKDPPLLYPSTRRASYPLDAQMFCVLPFT